MNNYTDLDVAIETLAAKIAIIMKKRREEATPEKEQELKKLLEERRKLYSGDKEMIQKVLTVYGPEVKKVYNEV